MYYLRSYTSGGADYDPRQKLWAEFHCNACGENSDIDITSTRHTFQFDRERKCHHCGCVNPEDKVLNLQAQIDKLTADKERINVEIDRLCNEIEQCDEPSVSAVEEEE